MFNVGQKIINSIVKKVIKSLSRYNTDYTVSKSFLDYYRSSHHIKALRYLEKNNLYSFDQYKYENKKPQIGKKKVALCLHGFLRTYDRTYQSCVRNIIDIYNPDIFIYSPRLIYHNSGDLSKKSDGGVNNIFANEEDVVKKYGDNVKSIKLWDYDESKFAEISKFYKLPDVSIFNRSSIGILSFFYHIKKSIELKREYEIRNNIEYDIVIRARPDLAFYSPFILNEKELGGIENTVYSNAYYQILRNHCKILADGSPIPPFLNVKRGEMLSAGELLFNDLVSVTSSKNADILAEAYDKIHLYYERGVPFSNEALMAYHIIFENKMNIDVRNFAKLCIFRKDDLDIDNANKMIKKIGYHEYSNLHF